jgi:hypothetical protein
LERSLPRDPGRHLALAALLLGCAASCGSKVPETDPATITALAKTMLGNVPTPGAPNCSGEQVLGGVSMTMVTLLQLGQEKVRDIPERQPWSNPPELDAPAARVLLDEQASKTAKRRAAAELTAAPFYLVYLIDHIDVPMALGIKELKRGGASGRALRYDKQGRLECVRVFLWSNDKAVSDEAIARSNKALIDPAVAKRLRDDLTAQLLRRIAALGAPPPSGEIATKPPDGMGN